MWKGFDSVAASNARSGSAYKDQKQFATVKDSIHLAGRGGGFPDRLILNHSAPCPIAKQPLGVDYVP